MQIYSETIFSYLYKCEEYLKSIINQETPYQLKRTRIHIGHVSVPFQMTMFEHKNKLGYFDPLTFRIGLNQTLMYQIKDHILKDILRHELAHLICFVRYQTDDAPHGTYFKQICTELEWSEKVSKASLNIDMANETVGNLVSEKLIIKIKNLLKLADSDNEHESALATMKANQLLLKHNLLNIELDRQYVYVDSIYTSKRHNAKIDAFYKIVSKFMVKPLIVSKGEVVELEVTGSKENIELARYIVHFLDHEFERLWKRQSELKGSRAKNSFFRGLSLGFEMKLEQSEQSFSTDQRSALVQIYQDLDIIQQKIHKRISTITSHSKTDDHALSSGISMGKNLTITPGIKQSQRKIFQLGWNL